MRGLTFVAVALVVTATAPLTSCDRQSPTSPTPIQQQPPPSATNTNLTGPWRGTMGEPQSYETIFIEGTNVSITLTQTDSRVEGTLHCDSECLYSVMRMTGTIENSNIVLRGDYPFGNCSLDGTLDGSGSQMLGSWRCSQPEEWGHWVLFRSPTTTPEPAPCVPDLVWPAPGAALDNGRTDSRDAIEWSFDWTDCASADDWQSIAILGPGERRPSVYYSRVSSYGRVDCTYIAEHNRFNWRLWVRSWAGESWGAWSPAHTFDVERPDSDPMSPRCPAR